MELKYEACKKIITNVLEEEKEPTKFYFEGVGYTPQELLREVQNQSETGEKFLRQAYDAGRRELEELVTEIKNKSDADKPFLYGGQRVFSCNDIVKEMEEGTEFGLKFLKSHFSLAILNSYVWPYEKIE